MPFLSRAQQRWGHTPAGVKALGGESAVKEWDQATPKNLPEKTMAKKHWLGGAIKHPGALTAAAKKHGVSKMQEAEKESHSSNPSIRGRGLLGKRLISGHGKP
jgi:hypothetical protein